MVALKLLICHCQPLPAGMALDAAKVAFENFGEARYASTHWGNIRVILGHWDNGK